MVTINSLFKAGRSNSVARLLALYICIFVNSFLLYCCLSTIYFDSKKLHIFALSITPMLLGDPVLKVAC